LPPLQPQQVENTQLLANPGFETPDAGWGLYEWPPREKTSDQLTGHFIYYSQDVVHSGKVALCFDFTKLTPERLLAARQGLKPEALAPYEGRMIRSSAWIWVAKGPATYGGNFGTRQWGEPGTPPLDFHIIPLGGSTGEWIHCSQEFRLKLGSTRSIDFNIWLPNVPDITKAPVVYVDDVSLEVLADPPLAAELLCGKVIAKPDNRVPILAHHLRAGLATGPQVPAVGRHQRRRPAQLRQRQAGSARPPDGAGSGAAEPGRRGLRDPPGAGSQARRAQP